MPYRRRVMPLSFPPILVLLLEVSLLLLQTCARRPVPSRPDEKPL